MLSTAGMKSLHQIIYIVTFCCTVGNVFASSGLAKYVNPFIGTTYTGHTHPCATYPLGMIQAGPQTGNFHWDYAAGYNYDDTAIQGFTQNRFNGTGALGLSDILIQPFSQSKSTDYSSSFQKSSEKAQPGYYKVRLSDNQVDVEITASPHVAFHKYTFDKGNDAKVYLDFQNALVWRQEHFFTHIQENSVTFESDYVISGYTRSTQWANRTHYFVIEFEKPVIEKKLLDKRNAGEKAPRYVLKFDLQGSKELNVKISMSSTGLAGAKQNLTSEIPHWDFNKVHKFTLKAWEKVLSRIRVKGTPDQKTNFYTAMYRLYLQPNNIADTDGRYVGPNRKISLSKSGKFYSTWSQWDIFRAAFPLYTILSPEVIPDFVNSMLDYSEQQGHLPVWSFWGQETYTMIGNHSVPMVVDAVLKDFEGIDKKRAYAEVKKTLTSNHHKSDWSIYDKYGYYPFDTIKTESVSRTLESGFDDYCASLLAKSLNEQSDYLFFKKRSEYYKKLFDDEYKAMRGKDSQGNWRTPFVPYNLARAESSVGDYTEGNALQYTWHVLQDIPGLIKLFGSDEKACEHLDILFAADYKSEIEVLDNTGLIGQYAHGNEPSHHVAYLYTYLNKPGKTQELIRKICTDFYKNSPDGLIGNDDCGQMSAWYLFSTMGFYPVNPVSGEFRIGAPQLPYMKIDVGNGYSFRIIAKNLSAENMYVDKIKLNGKPYDKGFITYDDIMKGGKLEFYMKK